MRLFAAIDLDASARAAVAASIDALATGLAGGGTPSSVRWVRPEQLHFTLRFLGEVSAQQVASVQRALSVPWMTGAFDVRLAGVDLFPFSGEPRVVWQGLAEGRDQMVALKAELDRRLVSAGFGPEARRFRVHLTLGRVNRKIAVSGRDLRTMLSEHEPETAGWTVDRVTLYESRVSFRGVTYHVVDTSMLVPSRET